MNENKNELVVRENQHIKYIDDNLQMIQNQNKLNDSDLKNFAIQCKRTGLDPITRQIYAIPMQGRLNIMASIDGLRLIAERSGLYEGQTAPEWCGPDGKWVDVWLKKEPPSACKVGVHKNKFKEPLIAIAIFDEYAKKTNGKLDFMWSKMPALMIAKVAESLALRKAFPNEMSGIYSTEEMDQAVGQDQAPQAQERPAKSTPAQDLIVDTQNPFEAYTIQLGPNNRMTGTKLKDHTPGFLLKAAESSDNYYKSNNKVPHPNAVKFSEMVHAYLKHIDFLPF